MRLEIDGGILRRGETSNRPYGGKIADMPLPKAIHELASSRGLESQLALAKALGHKNNSLIGFWYSGRGIPYPKQFAKLIELFNLKREISDQERDNLLTPYGILLKEKKEKLRVATYTTHSDRESTFHSWIKTLCLKKRITIQQVESILSRKIDQNFGITTYSELLQEAPQKLNLTVEETNEFADAIADTIQSEIRQGHRFDDSDHGGLRGRKIKKAQANLKCETFNGEQAGKLLGVTRERIRQLRKEHNLPQLLTSKHIDFLNNLPPRDKHK